MIIDLALVALQKNLTDLYQNSSKQNTTETNFIHKYNFEDHNAYLNGNIFFKNPDKKDNILNGRIFEDD